MNNNLTRFHSVLNTLSMTYSRLTDVLKMLSQLVTQFSKLSFA